MQTTTFNTWTRDNVELKLHADGETFQVCDQKWTLKLTRPTDSDGETRWSVFEAVNPSEHPTVKVRQSVHATLPHLSNLEASDDFGHGGVVRDGKPNSDPRIVAAHVLAEII